MANWGGGVSLYQQPNIVSPYPSELNSYLLFTEFDYIVVRYDNIGTW